MLKKTTTDILIRTWRLDYGVILTSSSRWTTVCSDALASVEKSKRSLISNVVSRPRPYEPCVHAYNARESHRSCKLQQPNLAVSHCRGRFGQDVIYDGYLLCSVNRKCDCFSLAPPISLIKFFVSHLNVTEFHTCKLQFYQCSIYDIDHSPYGYHGDASSSVPIGTIGYTRVKIGWQVPWHLVCTLKIRVCSLNGKCVNQVFTLE